MADGGQNSYALDSSGQVWVDGTFTWGGIKDLQVGANGNAYMLHTSGLFQERVNGGWTQTVNNVTKFVMADGGQNSYALDSSGQVWVDGTFTWGGIKDIQIASDGSLYMLHSTGLLQAESAGSLQSITTNAGHINPDDLPFYTGLRLAHSAGPLTRQAMLNLFQLVEQQTISADVLDDMRELVTNATYFGMPDYVQNLAGKVVNSSVYGFSLHAGASGTMLMALVGDAFEGDLEPAYTPAYQDDYQGAIRYASITGTLFDPTSGVPSVNDVSQGELGDCVLIASLAEVAAQNPKAIENMFIANGDGTWTVRLSTGSGWDYVTVNNQLPLATTGSPAGTLIFDSPVIYNPMTGKTTTILWVALAEKAFAEVNAEGWLAVGQMAGQANYGALSHLPIGPVDGELFVGETVLGAITGWKTNGSYKLPNPISAEGILQSGGMYLVGTDSSTARRTGLKLVEDHMYAAIWDATSNDFLLINPWGMKAPTYGFPFEVHASLNQLGQFEVSYWINPQDVHG